jgi:hypothetical protein
VSVAVTGGLSVEAVASVVVAASAGATFYGIWTRRRVDERRSAERRDEALDGWKDDRGGWHLGVIDKVDGYVDTDGVHHEGLVDTVAHVSDRLDRHVKDRTAHAPRGGTR